jgi:hypothetical protein
LTKCEEPAPSEAEAEILRWRGRSFQSVSPLRSRSNGTFSLTEGGRGQRTCAHKFPSLASLVAHCAVGVGETIMFEQPFPTSRVLVPRAEQFAFAMQVLSFIDVDSLTTSYFVMSLSGTSGAWCARYYTVELNQTLVKVRGARAVRLSNWYGLCCSSEI